MVLLEEIKSAIPQEKAKLLEFGEYLRPAGTEENPGGI